MNTGWTPDNPSEYATTVAMVEPLPATDTNMILPNGAFG